MFDNGVKNGCIVVQQFWSDQWAYSWAVWVSLLLFDRLQRREWWPANTRTCAVAGTSWTARSSQYHSLMSSYVWRRQVDSETASAYCECSAFFELFAHSGTCWLVTRVVERLTWREETRSRSTSVLGEEIRTHNSTSPRTSLVEIPGEDAVPVVCSDSSVSACYGTALPRRDTSVDHWNRCSVSTQIGEQTTLIVPSTRRSTLGDRAFPVVAARAWNTRPASVRSTPSLAGFRQQLKSTIFPGFLPITVFITVTSFTAFVKLLAWVSVLHLLHYGKPLLHQSSLHCVTVKYNRSVLHLTIDLSAIL